MFESNSPMNAAQYSASSSKVADNLVGITMQTPLRLGRVAEIAFPGGGMTASGLRREAKKGRLRVERIANKDYTTLENIEEMRTHCQISQKVHDCGSGQEKTAQRRLGSSGTEINKSALDAAMRKAQKLKQGSPLT